VTPDVQNLADVLAPGAAGHACTSDVTPRGPSSDRRTAPDATPAVDRRARGVAASAQVRARCRAVDG
jgi:hypothetical protein